MARSTLFRPAANSSTMHPARRCPKVELHCHLLGAISPALLERARAGGAEVLVDPELLASVYPVRGLNAFQRYVEVLKPYQTAAPESMLPILAAHIEDLKAQDVVYTELMVSPAMFPTDPERFVDAVSRW